MKKNSLLNLDKILTLLNDRLAMVFSDKKWHLIVCGGTALNALNLVCRTTKDIDVIGELSGNDIQYTNFNSLFYEQIEIISEMLDLPDK